MIVVADSSPLHYLILLGEADLLRQLYAEVVIPDVVASELTRPQAPADVRAWLSASHPWLHIAAVTPDEMRAISDVLDNGERAAIALAEKTHADLLLIDEIAGRAEARRRQIRVTGTLGVLRAAAELGLIDVRDVLRRLEATNFYVDEELIASVFARWL